MVFFAQKAIMFFFYQKWECKIYGRWRERKAMLRIGFLFDDLILRVRETDRGRKTDSETKKKERKKERKKHIQTNKQMVGQTDRIMERQNDGKTREVVIERQRER